MFDELDSYLVKCKLQLSRLLCLSQNELSARVMQV